MSPKLDVSGLEDNCRVHFVPMAAVSENFGGLDASQLRPLREVRKGYTYFSEGDVLFAKITPCMENGKGALVPRLRHNYAFGSTEFHVLRPGSAIVDKWLAHYLSQPDFRRVARQHMSGTAGQLRVPSKWLSSVGLPLPPRAEQTRIVEKLEELLSDLDAGVAELKTAQRKLAQYRQSLLKAAVEGALTADWRAARAASADPPGSSSPRTRGSRDVAVQGSASMDHQPATVATRPRARGNDEQQQSPCVPETGAELLQRILVERRARWEKKQFAKFAEQDKTPPNNWKDKYPEPAASYRNDLPPLPQGWMWASIDQLASVGTGVTPLRSNRAYFDNGKIPWTTSGALNDQVISAASGFVTNLAVTDCRLTIYPAGSLLVAMYGEGKTRGKCSELAFPSTINQAIAAIVFEGGALAVRRHVKTFLLNAYEAMRKQASGGVQPNLNLQIIKTLSVPLPPLDEQYEIQCQLDEQITNYRALDDSTLLSIAQAAAQRKNILKSAFAGQLVPQDPNDEPASNLLDRIRTARVDKADSRAANKRSRKARGSS